MENRTEERFVDSRTLAEIMNKEHNDLIREIRNYEVVFDVLGEQSEKYFIQSHYKDSDGNKRPCFLLTYEGCKYLCKQSLGQNLYIDTLFG